MAFRESTQPSLKQYPQFCDYVHKWIFLGKLSWLYIKLPNRFVKNKVSRVWTLLGSGCPLLAAQSGATWLSRELEKVMSVNRALTKGQRKNVKLRKLIVNAVAHMSKVFQIIKPLLLILHSRGIVCDQDKFLI